MIKILIIAGTLSDVTWFLAAIRQSKREYSYYFVPLGMAGMTDFLITCLRQNANYATIFVFLFSFFTFINLFDKKLYSIFKVPIIIIGATLVYFFDMHYNKYVLVVIILLHSIILLFFLRLFIKNSFTNLKFDIFLLPIVIYETSLLMRFFFALTGTNIGYLYYLITSILEVFIGIFFTIFTEDSPALQIKLHSWSIPKE